MAKLEDFVNKSNFVEERFVMVQERGEPETLPPGSGWRLSETRVEQNKITRTYFRESRKKVLND